MRRLLLLPLLAACPSGLDPVDPNADTDTASDTDDTDDTDEPCPTWYADADGDGFGDPDVSMVACEQPEGYVDNALDCDDTDPKIFPGSTHRVDGVDSDCDGRRDWLVDLWVSVDDAFELCINHEDNIVGSGDDWTHGYHFQVWLKSGTHVVGIEGWDLYYMVTAAIAHIEISDGTIWVTDDTWRYDPNPTFDMEHRAGWCEPGFDDSDWMNAIVHGPIGTDPWTSSCGPGPCDFPDGSPANWIWDHFPVELNTQYLRKEIVLP